MSSRYKIHSHEYVYFVTFTVIDWIDVFIRNEYRQVILESLRYCQQNKGLKVYAWCLMTSHIHLIISSAGEMPLEGIIRDAKAFTSRRIHEILVENEGGFESRRSWMLSKMEYLGKRNSSNKGFQFWQQNYHAILLDNSEWIDQKLDYIHYNPVVAGFVHKPADWKYSSAIDYYTDEKGLLDLVMI